MKILVADDNEDMRKILTLYLKKEGWQVSTAKDGQDALRLCQEQAFDLAVLDWMMPYYDGIYVCRELRTWYPEAKIIILTAKDTNDNEITGLTAGADDYIRKPFEPKILVLRIKKLLGLGRLYVCRGLTLNPDAHTVSRDGSLIRLSKKEYELLKYFITNQDIILSRSRLLDGVWGPDYEGDDRTVDTHIRRLREKIGNDYIKTHIGLGYCMEKHP